MTHTRYNNQFTLSDNTSKDSVAREATKVIMEEYQKALIDRCVRTRYSFMDDYEIEKISVFANRIAQEDLDKSLPTYSEREEAVFNLVKEHFDTADTIIPRGFVDFKMRQLYSYAELFTERGADMYFDEKEFEEFAYLLSVLVSEKESREDVLHIVWTENTVRLLNILGRDVTDKYEEEFVAAAKKKGIGKEDLAISAVISAAPKKLVFHSPPENSPLKDALSKIFEGKTKLCKGCNICKKC